jgi:hypothetical protein
VFDKNRLPPEARWKAEVARRAFDEHFIERGAEHYVPKPKKQKRRRPKSIAASLRPGWIALLERRAVERMRESWQIEV